MPSHQDSISLTGRTAIAYQSSQQSWIRKTLFCRMMLHATLLFSNGRVSTIHAWRLSGFVPSRRGSRTCTRHFIAFSGEKPKNHVSSIPLTGRHCYSVRFSSKGSNQGKEKKSNKSKKYKINPNIQQSNLDKLAAEFDELAKKEGFDNSMAYFADDSTFQDDFTHDEKVEVDFGMDGELSPDDFDVRDFEETDGGDRSGGDDDDGGDVSDYFLNVDLDEIDVKAEQSMEARIEAARHDMGLGRISGSDYLDSFALDATSAELKRLGFKREANPFGNDETPRKKQFILISNAMTCSACGADFQCTNDRRPGYLPPDKFATQVKLSKIEELQKLQEKAESYKWSPEEEIEFLIQASGGDDSSNIKEAADINVDEMAQSMGLDLVELAEKKVICQRCHGLQNFGKVAKELRPGWTDEPTLSQEKFRELLRPIRDKPAVIIALVDIFDFSGSVLPELDAIAGDNPVILAANKADLLPSQMGRTRVENWVRRELEYIGTKSIANIGGAVRLVSCKKGFGIAGMLAKARGLADEMGCDVYVVGAANAGKSTLINHILGSSNDKATIEGSKIRAGNANKLKGAVTTSTLPGTTLRFIKIDLGEGKSLYDTPGLLVNGTLTQLLTPEELKMVIPKK